MLTVYLDNKDYSILSNPNVSGELKVVKEKLLKYSSEGRVKFYYSSMVFSEILPIEEQAEKYAIERANFLEQLCQNNVLFDYEKLEKFETSRLIDKKAEFCMPAYENGDWFPEIDISEEIENPDFPRFSVECYMKENPGFKDDFPELWEVGESFVLNNEEMSSAYNRARSIFIKPSVLVRLAIYGKELGSLLAGLIRSAGEVGEEAARDLLNDHLKSVNSPDISRVNWKKMVDGLVLRSAKDEVSKIGADVSSGITLEDVKKYCPGANTMMQLLFNAIWDDYKGVKVNFPDDNQVQDSLHAMYAPYVNIFCADRYTASHLKELVNGNGTRVISKTTQLPDVIEELLAGRSPV